MNLRNQSEDAREFQKLGINRSELNKFYYYGTKPSNTVITFFKLIIEIYYDRLIVSSFS